MTESIAIAMLGGCFGFLLSLLELRNVPRASRPSLSDPFFWCPVLINPFLGGVLAYVYVRSGTELTPALALNVGVASPVILRGMASTNAPTAIDVKPGA